MINYFLVLTVASLLDSIGALSSNLSNVKSSEKIPVSTISREKLKKRTRLSKNDFGKAGRKHDICPEPDLDLDMDRREATFAMIGQLWASSAVAATIFTTSPSNAVFGADANIALPNMMESIDNRINKQCLVESLGNRECLVYLDPEKKIYKGADVAVLVERLEKATAALAEIPVLVNEKKWSKVNSVITGPMGGLGVTMDKLSKLSENEVELCRLEKIVKNDLYAIAAAVDRKNGAEVLKMHDKATEDLVAYAKALS